MAEIFVTTYLVLGLLGAVLLWRVLMISKRLENSQQTEYESQGCNRPLAPKTN
jgi:hypothetical protein